MNSRQPLNFEQGANFRSISYAKDEEVGAFIILAAPSHIFLRRGFIILPELSW